MSSGNGSPISGTSIKYPAPQPLNKKFDLSVREIGVYSTLISNLKVTPAPYKMQNNFGTYASMLP